MPTSPGTSEEQLVVGTSLSGVTKTTQGSTGQLVLEQNSQLGLVTTEMQLQYVPQSPGGQGLHIQLCVHKQNV